MRVNYIAIQIAKAQFVYSCACVAEAKFYKSVVTLAVGEESHLFDLLIHILRSFMTLKRSGVCKNKLDVF